MTITSNSTTIKKFIGEVPRTNLGNLSGRVVTFIKHKGLLFATAAKVSNAAFSFFRSKETPIKPEDNKVKDGQIIGSRLNYPSPKDSQFEKVKSFPVRTTKNPTYRNTFIKEVLCSNLANHNTFEIPFDAKLHGHGPNKQSLIRVINNHTKHSVNVDRLGNLFLDGFQVQNEYSISTYVFSFKDREDLLCLQYYGEGMKSKKWKLIVLEKVNKQFVISWTADAQDFGSMPVEGENYSCIFSISKIDDVINGKRVGAFLSLTWDHSAFASIPRDVLNHIVKSL